jgi:formate dehydrogenase subunit gamma
MTDFFPLLTILGVIGLLAVIAGHYLLFGPKDKEIGKGPRIIKRFTVFERLLHTVTVLSFCTLGLTGLIAGACLRQPLSGWLRAIHIGAAPFFGLGMMGMALQWAENARFAACDWDWAKKFGGYLGDRGHIDAERFNAGQKAFFWVVCILSILVVLSGLGRSFPIFNERASELIFIAHRYFALIMILGVIVHSYLGSIVNPGTVLSIVTGFVTKPWAEHHHPLWWKKIADRYN